MTALASPTNIQEILGSLGLSGDNAGAFCGEWLDTRGPLIESINPTTGVPIARVRTATSEDYEKVATVAVAAFRQWRSWPAPRRGEIVRQLGEELRCHKEALGRLITLEMGKVLSEALGEVQEMIDMVDLAVGMSRQLHGLAMHSERRDHRMYEQWHPIGPVGIITAFNFPGAVWSWNSTLAAICGDSMIWKPSAKTPLCAVAITRLAQRVLAANDAPPIFCLVVGDRHQVGTPLVADPRVPLVSATGSVAMGRRVGETVASRLGRSLLELGGNNGVIVLDDADLDLALRAVLFSALGTAGQRCTTTRRLLLQRGVAAEMKRRLVSAYRAFRVGDPMDPDTQMGPLVDAAAVRRMSRALSTVQAQGGEILHGGQPLEGDGYFVQPTLVEAHPDMAITREETFAPILYLFEVEDLEEAIELHNSVPQGLSSALFTTHLLAAERFLSASGSDCGIANVNLGTSGAEIGGAFGGEKDTGGGREAGSDSWKLYMRRQTCTINFGHELPLAQGVTFDLDGATGGADSE